MKKTLLDFRVGIVCAVALVILAPGISHAGTVYSQDFDTPGWLPGSISLDTGDWQSNVVQDGTIGRVGIGGAFTRLGGYSSDFGNGFTVTQDIFLDTTWASGTGFEWSVAANGSDGNHQRDYIWNVGMDGTDLLVNVSNNASGAFNAFTLNNDNGGNNFTVADSGWYTFEQVFYESGGLLAVDFNLYDPLDVLVYTATRPSNAEDTIPGAVGGNRYGWFVYNSIDGLKIDNTCLTTPVVPIPGAAGLGLLGLALVGARRRFRKVA